ncbi:MAG TPA: hypothetical protein DD618_00020 [Acholeplasmatales bacterium]|nr:hypothetical protein [Acholeplasmatales bacterium]
MAKSRFTPEQVTIISKNPYVKSLTDKYINFTDEFKKVFLQETDKGKPASRVFSECGFDIIMLGQKTAKNGRCRFRKVRNEERSTGLEDLRKMNSGRPITRNLTNEENVARLNSRIEYLKAENEFLKGLRKIERRAMQRIKSKQKKNSS